MGPLVTTTGSHPFVVKQSLLCPVGLFAHLIHIDVEKLGIARRN